MTTFTIDTEDPEILKAVKALLKGFKVPFKEKIEKPYDPEFLAMIKESEQQVKDGKTVKLESISDLWDLTVTK